MRHDEQLILDTLETVQDVVEPLVEEVEGQEEVDRLREESDFIDASEASTMASPIGPASSRDRQTVE